MIKRRQFLGGCSAIALFRPNRAEAIIPAVIAALAAIALIATATAKAADAIAKAVDSGATLWSKLKSAPEAINASRQLQEKKAALAFEMQIRRETIGAAATSQMANAAVVNTMNSYALEPAPEKWALVRAAIEKATLALESAGNFLRQNAVWFPLEAQDALGKLPSLYDQRRGIMADITSLPNQEPPQEDVKRLVEAYDLLRIQSLKLLKALSSYVA